ncbi:hypothetical protein M885DRAFT_619862 [Pelagophyceae sp. CCMP2097]|nr:hypothetical protein M885DRAFT_619862 [Pelagophyceae sp. CCMP2097]
MVGAARPDKPAGKSFASKNLNAVTRAPPGGAIQRSAYGGGGRLLVLGRHPGADKVAKAAVAAPTPLNTPSLRRENRGQDLSVKLVPGGGGGWTTKEAEDEAAAAPAPPRRTLGPQGGAADADGAAPRGAAVAPWAKVAPADGSAPAAPWAQPQHGAADDMFGGPTPQQGQRPGFAQQQMQMQMQQQQQQQYGDRQQYGQDRQNQGGFRPENGQRFGDQYQARRAAQPQQMQMQAQQQDRFNDSERRFDADRRYDSERAPAADSGDVRGAQQSYDAAPAEPSWRRRAPPSPQQTSADGESWGTEPPRLPADAVPAFAPAVPAAELDPNAQLPDESQTDYMRRLAKLRAEKRRKEEEDDLAAMKARAAERLARLDAEKAAATAAAPAAAPPPPPAAAANAKADDGKWRRGFQMGNEKAAADAAPTPAPAVVTPQAPGAQRGASAEASSPASCWTQPLRRPVEASRQPGFSSLFGAGADARPFAGDEFARDGDAFAARPRLFDPKTGGMVSAPNKGAAPQPPKMQHHGSLRIIADDSADADAAGDQRKARARSDSGDRVVLLRHAGDAKAAPQKPVAKAARGGKDAAPAKALSAVNAECDADDMSQHDLALQRLKRRAEKLARPPRTKGLLFKFDAAGAIVAVDAGSENDGDGRRQKKSRGRSGKGETDAATPTSTGSPRQPDAKQQQGAKQQQQQQGDARRKRGGGAAAPAPPAPPADKGLPAKHNDAPVAAKAAAPQPVGAAVAKPAGRPAPQPVGGRAPARPTLAPGGPLGGVAGGFSPLGTGVDAGLHSNWGSVGSDAAGAAKAAEASRPADASSEATRPYQPFAQHVGPALGGGGFAHSNAMSWGLHPISQLDGGGIVTGVFGSSLLSQPENAAAQQAPGQQAARAPGGMLPWARS